jgi:hypothetical protein
VFTRLSGLGATCVWPQMAVDRIEVQPTRSARNSRDRMQAFPPSLDHGPRATGPDGRIGAVSSSEGLSRRPTPPTGPFLGRPPVGLCSPPTLDMHGGLQSRYGALALQTSAGLQISCFEEVAVRAKHLIVRWSNSMARASLHQGSQIAGHVRDDR